MGKRTQPPVLGGFDSMPLEQWERVKAENWARPVADVDPPAPTRATLTDGGPITARATMPIAAPSGKTIGEVSWSLGEQLVRIADVWVPQRIDATFYGGPHLPRVELTLEVLAGVPRWTRVELVADPGSPPVLAKHMTLAAGRLSLWSDMILKGAAQDSPDAPEGTPSWADEPVARKAVGQRSRRWKLTPEHLADVADIYRANITGEPVKAIKAHFGVPERTAARWVQVCRSDEYQLLPKTTRGQRKA